MSENRKLAAILAADVVGYSRLASADEDRTLARLRALRSDLIDPTIAVHNGRVIKRTGDGALVEFRSVVDAVRCAIEVQNGMVERNAGVPQDRRIEFRIGIHLGDVVEESDGDLMGDGVNIASRLEGVAAPGAICLSEDAYRQVKARLDLSVSDLGITQLKNIAEPIRVYSLRVGTAQAKAPNSSEPTTSWQPAALPPKLSIAVLPFDNLSGDPSQQYLSDGITEDITTELSRFRNLTVAARHASFHLARMGINPMQAARDLGANYVIEGSVRKAGERIRITAQLIDARTGNHVWAERYDRECHDIFAVQDEVVAAIVTTLEGRMVAAAALQVRKRPTSSWTAYDFFLQGRELADANMEKEAVPLFSRATAIDPDFAHAHAWLAIALLGRYWFDTDPRTLHEASLAAQRAMELDSNDPTVHHANGMVMVWLREYERAGVHFDRAVALNPADAQIRADRANWLRYAGRPEEALASIDDALKRTPFPPHWFWVIRAKILLELRRYGEVVAALDNMPKKDHPAWLTLAAAHDHLGHAALAAHALAKARELRPSISSRELIAVNPYAHRDALKPLLDGLRNAGLPE